MHYTTDSKNAYKITQEFVVSADTEQEAWDKHANNLTELTWPSIQRVQSSSPAYMDPETLTFDQEDKEHPRR